MVKYGRHTWRLLLIGCLLFTMSMPVFAQDSAEDEAVVIVGSRYMEELITNLITAYEGDFPYTLEAEGVEDGFARLCDGTADVSMSTRPITDEEMLNCDNVGIQFVEVVAALDSLVLAVNADSPLNCIAVEDLGTIFQRETPLSWIDLDPTAEDVEVNIYGSSSTGRAFSTLRALLNENEPRTAYEVFETPADVVEPLQSADINALAFMSLAEWETLDNPTNTRLVEFRTAAAPTCVAPSTGTITTRDYPAARLLMLYVNATSLGKGGLIDVLRFGFGDAESRPVAGIATELGFSVPLEAAIDRNINNVTGAITGRTFSRGDSPVTINTAIEGNITIEGSGAAYAVTQGVYASFANDFPNVTVDVKALGNDQAWANFCAGTTAVIQVTRPATDEEAAACAEMGINPYPVYLGSQAVVMTVKADAGLPQCLDYSQIQQLLVAQSAATEDSSDNTPAGETTESEDTSYNPNGGVVLVQDGATPVPDEESGDGEGETPADDTESPVEEPLPLDPALLQGPARWNEINSAWPDLPILVLAPSLGAFETDIILSHAASGRGVLRRTDAPIIQETPSTSGLTDVDYRLGATGNFDGAITYVFWNQYTAADNLALVEIDGGRGCVAPSESTLQDGSYPFALSSWLVFSESGVSDELVASLLWQTHSLDVLNILSAMQLVGFDRAAFENERDDLFTLIENALAASTDAPVGEDTSSVEDEITGDETPSEDSTPAEETDDSTTDEIETNGETGDTEATPAASE
ncbi:MAG: substrate-binding domain-containing protein [Anaerolineales bacterium]|nr:substrate-binding domain-containing protein [Anaerolineales bacterium]